MPYKMECITNENNEDHNKKLPYVPDQPYRMLEVLNNLKFWTRKNKRIA